MFFALVNILSVIYYNVMLLCSFFLRYLSWSVTDLFSGLTNAYSRPHFRILMVFSYFLNDFLIRNFLYYETSKLLAVIFFLLYIIENIRKGMAKWLSEYFHRAFKSTSWLLLCRKVFWFLIFLVSPSCI